MKTKLYMMMGAPGAGKSSFIVNHFNPETDIWISRDLIRFSLVDENEEYFSKEKEVFQCFIEQINKALNQNLNVFADATHISKASRNKLLRMIKAKSELEINIIWLKTPLKECIKHNNNRIGTRSWVPEKVIKRMYNNIQKPTLDEGFDNIYIVEDTIQIYSKGDK